MSRDDDKLLRQLSLVSFLLSQPRPVTSAEVRRSVEGYALMTDQAFARRFYEDREDLERSGIKVERDQADDGGEAYYLPEENYRLPDLAFTAEELTALSVALALLEGRFAYARLLRLALASLTHGHPDPTQDAVDRVAVALAPDAEAGPLGTVLARFDDAVTRGKTVTFSYLGADAPEPTVRTIDPYVLVRVGGHWYVVGRDHARDGVRMFRLGRIQGPVQFVSKRPRDFTVPPDFDPSAYRARPPWQLGKVEGDATILVTEDLAWWVERSWDSVSVREQRADGSVVFSTGYADEDALTDWVLGLGTQATLLGPSTLRDRLRDRLKAVCERHCDLPGGAPVLPDPPQTPPGDVSTDGPSHAPIPPARLARLLGLLYYLLDPGRGDAVALADIEHDLGLTRQETAADLDLLNLVNHGGGTYLLYARLEGDRVLVDREPEGELLAHPARLSPLTARALLLALDLVGDVLPVDGRRSLASARDKVERLVAGPAKAGVVEVHDLVHPSEAVIATVNRALQEHLVLRIEYYTAVREELSLRLIEPYLLFHSGDGWYLEAYCTKADGQRTFRLDRIRTAEATETRFEPRADIDLTSRRSGPLAIAGRETRWALVRFPEEWGRRLQERGLATIVEDGAALARIPYLDDRWLVREVIRYGGAAILLEPAPLRLTVAETASTLLVGYADD